MKGLLLACVAGSLILLSFSAAAVAAGAEWPDGRTTYRVLNAVEDDETLAVECKNNLCQVQPFRLILQTQATPVEVTTPLTLGPGGTAALDVPLDSHCGEDGTLTLTATPGSDLVGTVATQAVTTPTCFAPAGGFAFVAEVITAPSIASAPLAPRGESVLSQLRTVGDVTAAEVGLATGGAVVLVAVIAWPTALLNTAAAAAAARLRSMRLVRRARPRPTAPEDRETRWWWAVGGVLAAGMISVFVDPAAGFDTRTLRMVASMLTAFALEVFVGWALVLVLMRRLVPGSRPTYTFHLASLLVVAGAVAFSRLTGLQPGIVFGLVAGISFAAIESRRDRATETLVPLGYTFVIAMFAWAGYSWLGNQSGGPSLFASEALAAAVAAGLAALPLVLLPLNGLPGRSVFEWNRWVWAGCYAMALIGFFVVLMPMPTAWSEVDTSLAAWLCGYLAYVLIACIAWFATRERREVPVDAEAPTSGLSTELPARSPAELSGEPTDPW